MADFVIAKKTISVEFEDKIYPVMIPNIGMIENFEKKRVAASSEAASQFGLVIELLEMCGLPSEVAKQADAETLTALVNRLSGSQKKT